MRTGVIVTTYNRPESLALFLRGMQWQTVMPDEIVVADDGSAPAAWEAMGRLCRASGLPIVLTQQEDRGFRAAAARNMGIRRSSSEYLLFFDSDMVAAPDAVAVHQAMRREGRLLLGGRVPLDEAQTTALLRRPPAEVRFEDLWDPADKSGRARACLTYGRQMLQRRLGLARPHKPALLSCHFSCHRRDLEAINGFDERFVGWGYEDDDVARRLYMLGLRPRQLMFRARAVHLWHPSRRITKDERRTNPNRQYFYRKNVALRCAEGLEHEAAAASR
jgi:GT2 family glycosyltransferase